MSDLMKGKNIVVMGVANQRSIAWGIAQSLHREGANRIFTNRQQRSALKIQKLLNQNEINAELLVSCDVSDDESIPDAFAEIKEKFGVSHGVVHPVAFADTNELKGEYADTSRDGYLLAQETSAYSLVSVTKEARNLMTDGGSSVTQTYL